MISSSDFLLIEKIVKHYEGKLDKNFKIPLSEYEKRYANIWEALEKENIDLAFFFWYREMPGDGIYLTGYNPNIERASGVIAPGKRPMLIAGPESGLLASEVGLNLETKFVDEFSIPDEYYEGLDKHNLRKVIADYAGDIKKIGFLSAFDLIPAKFWNFFRDNFDVECVDCAHILEDLRYEKSDNEFKCMKQADIIASAAVRAMLAVSNRPGRLETEIAAVGDYVAKTLGASGFGFETIVNSGLRCSYVIGPASNKIINEGEIVQVGISPSYEGYKGVCRRTFVMGKRNKLQKEYFEIMNEAFIKAAEQLKKVVENDLPTNTIDLAARDFFASKEINGKNMKAYHMYSTCHGTGLTECLEKMVITPTKTEKYGKNVGIMLDLGCYGYPDIQIAGGCVENAFLKKGNTLIACTDVPIDVQDLVGKGI